MDRWSRYLHILLLQSHAKKKKNSRLVAKTRQILFLYPDKNTTSHRCLFLIWSNCFPKPITYIPLTEQVLPTSLHCTSWFQFCVMATVHNSWVVQLCNKPIAFFPSFLLLLLCPVKAFPHLLLKKSDSTLLSYKKFHTMLPKGERKF